MKRQIFMLAIAVCVLPVPGKAQWSTDPATNTPVCTDFYPQHHPAIASTGAGETIIAWTDERSSWTIFAQRLDANGYPQWTTDGIAVCQDSGAKIVPVIVPDGAGGAILAWFGWTSSSPNHFYAQRIDASGNVLWNPNGVQVSADSISRYYPKIIADGSGGAILVWQDAGNPNSGIDLYAQSISAAGQLRWPAAGIPVCTAPYDQGEIDAISDGQGGVIVSWTDTTAGLLNKSIYAQRIDSSGSALWATNGIVVSNQPGYKEFPRTATDGQGGAVISWAGTGNGIELDIYANRISANGQLMWGPVGIAVCTAAERQNQVLIVADNSGGSFLSWVDLRPGTGGIYAAHLNSSGTALWATDGIFLSNTIGDNLGLVQDGMGGAIGIWSDGTNQLFAQRINSAGTNLWTANGIQLSTNNYFFTTSDKPELAGVTIGQGAVVVAWTSHRGALGDIYAQYVGPNGEMVGVEGETRTEAPVQVKVAPNPSNGIFVVETQKRADRIMVTDVLGQVVTQMQPQGLSSELNLGEQSDGVYFLTVISGSKRSTTKLVKSCLN